MPIAGDFLDFLVENKMRNDREWFKQNNARYRRTVIEPLAELVTKLTPHMLEIDPLLITEPKVDRTISRINRDTRFSGDKSFYRANMWIVFMREKKLYFGLPAFYMDISPTGYSYGMGYYMAPPDTMNAVRHMIVSGDPVFKKALAAYKKQNVFSLEGDSYKRTRHPDHTPELRDWLDRKSMSFNTSSEDFDLLFSEKLADKIAAEFKTLSPMYQFFLAAEARKAVL